MISESSILFGTALAGLMALTALCGPDSARRSALVLGLNWLSCNAFVWASGNYTPWAWFWVMDLISALAVTSRPVSRWQAVIAFLYIGQIGIHTQFALAQAGLLDWLAITGGDPHRYISWLDRLLTMQVLLVLTWTGGHGLYRIWRARRGRFLSDNRRGVEQNR